MPGEVNQQRGDAVYNEFYRTGGWKYSFFKEYLWHRRNVVRRFALRRGMRMLEVACGNGFHTNLFRWMGFDCVGVDRSRAGIEWAQKRFPRCTFHCCDLSDLAFTPATFDVLIARGCSHYHYDLMSDLALGTTDTLMRYLRPGGVFVMVIATDLSGRREPGRIWDNVLEDYRRHFSSFGRRWSVDWIKGAAVCGLYNQPAKQVDSLDSIPETAPALTT